MSTVTSIPHLDVKFDGDSLSERAAAALEEVRVQHHLSQPSVCELTFFASRDPMSEVENLRSGSRLRLTLPSGSGSLFDGEITALEYSYDAAHGRTIHVRCYDSLHRLRKRQPVRVHVQVTPSDLARQLVADLGLSVEAETDGPLSQRLIQHRQSDLELLVDVSRQLEVNGEPACRSVLAKGWDSSRMEPHESRADNAHVGREVDADAPPDRFGIAGERTLAGELLPDDHHAAAVAQAELDLRIAREVTLSGVAEGDPDLLPGARVDISGVASSLAGQYVLTSVTHLINRRTGFVSEISSVPPVLEKRATAASAVWGTVTNVDDPDKLGRVRASLPALGTVETDLMGVMAAGAGSGKGFVILPDVGDHVLVLCIGGDVAQGIVLGGLYGTNNPGDYGVEGTSIRRFSLGTPGGQRIKLDDTGDCIRLENKGGSFVEFSPKKFLVHSAVDLEIEAPGRAVAIAGKTIDFRQA